MGAVVGWYTVYSCPIGNVHADFGFSSMPFLVSSLNPVPGMGWRPILQRSRSLKTGSLITSLHQIETGDSSNKSRTVTVI